MAKETMMEHLALLSEREDALWYPERLEGYEPPIKEEVKIPVIKSKWKHLNGIEYEVIAIANENDTIKYPTTVVYKGINGKIWSRLLTEWYRSFSKT
jgi:hypothetical protein